MDNFRKDLPGKYACVICEERDESESQIVVPFNWVDVESNVVYWSTSTQAWQDFGNCAAIKTSWPTYPLVKILVEGSKLI